ncbi:iron-sulfur cluster repair di-iron protein [Cytobacillus sp. NCCP-133]|uniref:iron-sulfur cluster repair di-iron protein n=1 Tax=Cytobacillus sp. NCCP-133 TaxID=766848 RepID=UPI002230385B|nr:iron-sulfur cluster repair di-iron protein [Cytobacillus sp. NCCP-133]GLB58879.1 iron-sulfur cluster repair di-iron protein [Cytobacillus sp. NCCP-133]
MTMQLSEDRLVKDLVNDFPKTSDVFKRHRIDFCCGGNISLIRAAAEQSADMEVLIKELNEVIQKENPKEDIQVWTKSSSVDIIEYVINQYHRPLEEELSQLSPYVTKVARVHGAGHEELLRVHELFFELKRELLEHTAKEEESVFPLLLKLEDPPADNREEIISYIQELEKEHDHAGAILKELREITSDFVPPSDACGSYRLVYKRLEDLEGQTFMHVHLENNILFPRYIN